MRLTFAGAFPPRRPPVTALLTLAVLALACGPARPDNGQAAGRRPPRSADEIPTLDRALRGLYERAAPSTVNLFAEPKHEHRGTGVVIDARGHVLTHAHHRLTPGTPFTAVFPGGKKVPGKLLGVHEPFDLSLVKLEGDGPWPAVGLGDPAAMKAGDLCVALGYPVFHHREGQSPHFRLARLLGRRDHYLLTSCQLNGGDSGGPLFDLGGKLLGNNNLFATESRGTGHTSVEHYRMARPLLLAGRHVRHGDPLLAGPFEDTLGLAKVAVPLHKSVLTVLDGGRPVALGLVVDASGWAVTKSSELPADAVTCRLADGRRLGASVAGRDRDHDLALLKLPAEGLAAAAWAERPPHVGQVLAAVGPDPWPLAFGVVASETRDLPGERGVLGFEVAPADEGRRGVRVKAVSLHRPRTAAVIRRGDVVTHVGGEATPDPESFGKAVDKHLGGPAGRPGERLRLTVSRDGGELTVAAPVEPPYVLYRGEDWSVRHDGFPAVFVYDGITLASECGGPLVGSDGKVAAVVLARAGSSGSARTYAVPGSEVRRVVVALRRAHTGAGAKR